MNNGALCELGKLEAPAANSERILHLLSMVREQLDSNCLDIEECVSTLVKHIVSHNAQVKTAVCDLIVRATAAQPDIGLLVVNTLTRDVLDPNPAVRCTAISTLCSIPSLQEQAAAALRTGFGDSSCSVRVAAVTGVGKVWRHSPSTVQEEGFIDQLYVMLRDTEPAVVTFALQTLNFILATEGGVVINRVMARHFLARLSTYPEQEACFMLDYLRQAAAVTTGTDPELRLELLNRLDPLLDATSGSLVLAVARLLARVVTGEERLVSSLAARIGPLLAGWVRKSGSRPEFQTVLLDFLLSLEETAYGEQLTRCLKQLHVRIRDPPEVSRRKAQLIARLANSDNCVETMNYLLNLLQRSAEGDQQLNKSALTGAVQAARHDETCRENLLRNLDLLVRTDRAAYFHLVLELVPALSLSAGGGDGTVTGSLVRTLLAAVVPDQASSFVIRSVLSLLAEFGDLVGGSLAPRLLEDLWRQERRGCWDPGLYRRLLATAYTLFLRQPAAMQPLLGRILHAASLKPNHQIQGLVRLYYQLLSSLPQDVS